MRTQPYHVMHSLPEQFVPLQDQLEQLLACVPPPNHHPALLLLHRALAQPLPQLDGVDGVELEAVEDAVEDGGAATDVAVLDAADPALPPSPGLGVPPGSDLGLEGNKNRLCSKTCGGIRQEI